MKPSMKRVPENAFFMAMISMISFLLIIFAAACQESEGPQEEAPPVDQRMQELESEVDRLEQDLSEKDSRIEQLEADKSTLESQVPKVHDVKTGDNHWQIAYDFLTQEKNIPDAEAKNMLSRVYLFHPVLVGFRVWNYFHEDVFGTFITQGGAPVSQKYLVKMEEEEEMEEKRAMEKRIEEMKGAAEDLRRQIQDAERNNESLKGQIASLEQKIEECREANSGLTASLNSLYYLAGTEDNLKDRGIIKGSFLGICGTNIKEVSSDDFQNSVDLRENDSLALTAEGLGLIRIKEVKILPKHLNEDEDFTVEISAGGKEATVRLLDKDKFRLARIILYVD